MRKKKIKSILGAIAVTLILGVGIVGCGADTSGSSQNDKPTLTLADAGWDSIQFHNSVAQFIIEEGYGYKTDVTNGSTPITFAALEKGDIDIYLEAWIDNLGGAYEKAIEAGSVKELSVNFDDNAQGIYVPTYLIEGDPERGIEPLAPDLKTVKDLEKYWELFKDPEEPSKGRIYGGIPGWAVDEQLREKIEKYRLDKTYNYFSPGSDAALSTSLVRAYESGEPWVGYYWEPTWIMGKYDMTLLEDAPYDEALWADGYQCEFPSVSVTVAVNKDMENKAPDVVEFLKNYKTSSELTSEALAYMLDNDTDTQEAAEWFLKTHSELWETWVPSEVAEKVNAALK